MSDVIGKVFHRHGQRYEVTRLLDHVNAAGRRFEILLLLSKCAECGEYFYLRGGKRVLQQGYLNRRCKKHRRPGKPVNPRNSAAAAKTGKC